MPPRIPLFRALRSTFRQPYLARRPLSTSHPITKPPGKKVVAGAVILGVGIYSFSQVTKTEPQSSKSTLQSETRELIAPSSRQTSENPGNAEKQVWSSSQDANPTEQSAGVKSEKDTSESGEGVEGDEEQGPPVYNPDTGEINWDCPCLGDMPHGPCGQQFREAFSCFLFSKADPQGSDCIEAFGLMQDCFREHPEVYKSVDEDEFDDASAEAIETATNAGEEKVKKDEEKGQSGGNEFDKSKQDKKKTDEDA